MGELKNKLIGIVGSESFFEDSETLEEYTSDYSFVEPKKPMYVVKPESMKEVQQIVKLPNENYVPLIPCSSGVPRFRGDTIPSKDGSVIVDLSRMKKIIRVDRRNKVALIEPGVTFGELQAEAEKHGLKVLMPLCPRATKSVIGSYLEREPIIIPKYHWDMTDPLLCTEVVFGTGDIFRTGSAAGPGTLEEQWESGQAQKNPLGPAQTDLVKIIQGSQGTMGIVTWASVKLELLPKVQKSFFVLSQNFDNLIGFIYRILRLKLGDECFVLNNLNMASILNEESEKIKNLKKELPLWTLAFCIAGYDMLPKERIEYQEKDIKDVAQQFGLEVTPEIPGIIATKLQDLICTKPSKEPYWKLRYKGASQDIFFLTTLDKVPEFIKAMNDEVEKHKYPKEDLGVYIQPIQQGRACHCEFNLTYDPTDSDAVRMVKDLFNSASEKLIDDGGFFSRPYGSWADMAYDKCEDTVTALRKVKEIFDPNKVMNPGKLCF